MFLSRQINQTIYKMYKRMKELLSKDYVEIFHYTLE
jgi:hypothetical protein